MAAGDAGVHEVLVRAVLLSICVHQLVHQSTPEPHVHQLLSAHAGAHEVLVRSASPASGVLLSTCVHQLVYQNIMCTSCYLLMNPDGEDHLDTDAQLMLQQCTTSNGSIHGRANGVNRV